MREVKFRAWHNGQQKMYPADELGADQLTLSVDGRGFINVHGGSRELSQFIYDMVPLQYTGLKDKHEQEIYEGDVVCFGERRNFQVAWADKYGAWYIVPCGNYENDSPLGKFEKAAEVIGNIYENPELLTTSPASGASPSETN